MGSSETVETTGMWYQQLKINSGAKHDKACFFTTSTIRCLNLTCYVCVCCMGFDVQLILLHGL